ncbi:MAG: hypothetical protein AB2799_22680 [Candidatus Thiodiazotropha sp.]
MNYPMVRYLGFLLTVTIIAGCSATPYKKEVDTFSKSVTTAVTTLEKVRLEEQAYARKLEDEVTAEQGIDLTTDPSCSESLVDALRTHIDCMAIWANHEKAVRAGDTNREPPDCTDPAYDMEKKIFTYYPFDSLKKQEVERCELFAKNRDTGKTFKFRDNLKFGPNTEKVSAGLLAYASALGEITDAKDVEELKSAVDSAKTALENLAKSVEERTSESIDKKTLLGPLSNLTKSFLSGILERMRYSALKETTASAQFIIEQSGAILSRSAVPIMYTRIRDTGQAYTDAIVDFNYTEPKFLEVKIDPRCKDTKLESCANLKVYEPWHKAKQKVEEKKDAYFALLNSHPADLLPKMTKAHNELIKALKEPKRRIDSFRRSLSDFSTQVKAMKKAIDETKR